MKPKHIVIVCFIGWVVLLASPRLMMPVGYLAYISLCVIVAWSAIRDRSTSWGSGLLLAMLLITLPFWVLGGYRVFEWTSGKSTNATFNALPIR